jgi:membrane protease YdiL (CAAX protease family)
MDRRPFPVDLAPPPRVERLRALFEILLASGAVSGLLAGLVLHLVRGERTDLLSGGAAAVAGYLLVEAGVLFVILFALLRANRESVRSLGAGWRRWKSNALIGLAAAPLLLLGQQATAHLFRVFLPGHYLESNPLTDVIRTPAELALFIVAALLAGGVKEELQRAFILDRFGRHLGGYGVGLLVWSLAFGAGHYLQGVQGMALATLFGLVFGLLYLTRGSLVAPMVAHGAYDTAALLLYWFAGGGGGPSA